MSNSVNDKGLAMQLGENNQPAADFPVGTGSAVVEALPPLPTNGFTLASDLPNFLQLPNTTFQPHPTWHYFGFTGGVRHGSYTLPADQIGIGQDFKFEGAEYRFGPFVTLPLSSPKAPWAPALFGEFVAYGTGPQSYTHNYWEKTVDEHPDMSLTSGDDDTAIATEAFTDNTTHLDRFGYSWAIGLDLIPPNALGALSFFDLRIAYEFTHSTPNHASEDPSWPTAAIPYTKDGVGQTTPAELLDVTSHAFRVDVDPLPLGGFIKGTFTVGGWNTRIHNPEDTDGIGQYVSTENSTLQANEVEDDTTHLKGTFWSAGVTADLSGIAMPRVKTNWGTDDYIGIYLDGDKDGAGDEYADALHTDVAGSQTGPLFFVRKSRYEKLRKKVEKASDDKATQYTQLQALLLKEAKHQYPQVKVQSVDSDVYAAILGDGALPQSANVQDLYDLYLKDPSGFTDARKTYISARNTAEENERTKANAKLERQKKPTDDDAATAARDAAVKAYADKENDRLGYLILIPRDRLDDSSAGTFWLTPNGSDCNDQSKLETDDCRPEITYYHDADGDGHGSMDPLESKKAKTQPAGYVTNSDDCDDTNAAVYPGATDIPGDGIDQDCVDGDADAIVDVQPVMLAAPPQIVISLKDLILDIGRAQYDDLLKAVKDQSYEFKLGELVLKNDGEKAEFAAAVKAIAATQLPIERVTVIGKADQDNSATLLAVNTHLAMLRAGFGEQIFVQGWNEQTHSPESLPELELAFDPSTPAPVYQTDTKGNVVKNNRGRPIEISSERGFSFIPVLDESSLVAAATKLNDIAEHEVNDLYLAYKSKESAAVTDTLFTAFVTKFQQEYPLAVVRERNYALLLAALWKSPAVGETDPLYIRLVSEESKAAIMAGATEHSLTEQDEHYQIREIQAGKTNTVSFTVPGLNGTNVADLVIYGDWETSYGTTTDNPKLKLDGDQLTITLPTANGNFSDTYKNGLYHFYVAEKPYATTSEKVGAAYDKPYQLYSLTVQAVTGEAATYVEPKPHGVAMRGTVLELPSRISGTASSHVSVEHYSLEEYDDAIQDLVMAYVAKHGNEHGFASGDALTITYLFVMNDANQAVAGAKLKIKKNGSEFEFAGFQEYLIANAPQVMFTDYSRDTPYRKVGHLATGAADF